LPLPADAAAAPLAAAASGRRIDSDDACRDALGLRTGRRTMSWSPVAVRTTTDSYCCFGFPPSAAADAGISLRKRPETPELGCGAPGRKQAKGDIAGGRGGRPLRDERTTSPAYLGVSPLYAYPAVKEDTASGPTQSSLQRIQDGGGKEVQVRV